MDPRDIKFPLKSGFTNLATEVEDSSVVRIHAVTLVFIQDAMRTAAQLAERRGSEVVTTADTIYALKITAMPDTEGRNYWERHPTWFDRMREFENDIMFAHAEDGGDADADADPDGVEDAYDPVLSNIEADFDCDSDDVEPDTEVAAPAPGYEVEPTRDMTMEDVISDAIASATYLTTHDMSEVNERWEAWNPPATSMDRILKKAVTKTMEQFM